jgi:hypothetical protein
MTGKALLNALLVAGGIAAAASIWAGAMLLPSPASRETPSSSAQAQAPAQAPTQAPAQAPPARIDPAAFGGLPTSLAMAPPASQASLSGPRSMSFPGTSFPMTSTPAASLPQSPVAATSPGESLQSIGATFTDTLVGAALPDFGGASALDGPADAGLDQPVSQADLAAPDVAPPTGKIIVIDHSEGTKLDPLRQRNWDLNSAQVIPPIAPAPRR